MRYNIQLQSKSLTSDDGGGGSSSWTKVADVSASIMPSSSKESVFGRDNQMREVTSHTITIRYRTGVTSKQRFYYVERRNGASVTRIFNIKGVLNVDNRGKFLEISCEEGVPT